MNVDTGEFAAIRSHVGNLDTAVGDLDCTAGELEDNVSELADTMRQLQVLLTAVLRQVAPAVRHAAHLQRQPRPPGRHRADTGGQRRDSQLPHCGRLG